MTRYRYLFSQLVRRELRRKYKGSSLGVVWYLVNPLVLLGAYTLMFGFVFRVQNIPDFPLFLMIGLMVWTFFQQSLLAAAESLIDQGPLIRKAAFPREAIPGASVAVQLVTFTALLVLMTPLTVALRGTLSPALLLLPLLVAVLFCFVLGCALMVSVLHAYFRDVAPTLTAALLPWFFVTPIFYRPGGHGFLGSHPVISTMLGWVNPVAPFIETLRAVVYDGTAPDPGRLLYVCLAAALALGLGVSVFRRLQGDLAVVV
ncbi:MAG: ABC transporter permease [Actinomycetota bacterium]|nr:ABC transporter permease [Actinomycetota bacterium]